MSWPSPILVIALMMTSMSDKVDLKADAVVVEAQHQHHPRTGVGCEFHLLTDGPCSVPIGQIDSGQCRGGNSLTPSLFTWSGDGFVDEQGRGCWWTPPTFTLQCDPQQEPEPGFVIGCEGVVTFNSSQNFWSCQTGDDDQVNIYTLPSGANCVPITLVADRCRPACVDGVPQPSPLTEESSSASSSEAVASPSSDTPPAAESSGPPSPTITGVGSITPFLTPPPSTPTDTESPLLPLSAPPPLVPTPSDCPTDLFGDDWEYPHLMVPVDKANPTVSYGPSFFGQISPNASTLFNFDIPQSDAGRRCTLFFAFPPVADLDPSTYTFTDTDHDGPNDDITVDFALLDAPATAFTTFDTIPGIAADLGALTLCPGNRYAVSSFPCPAGQRISFAMRESQPPEGEGGGGTYQYSDACLYYFQDILPSPFGLYVSKC